MDKITAENLFAKVGLGSVLFEPEQIFGGLMHKMFKVVSDCGQYAVKELNMQVMKREGVYDNLLFAEEIARAACGNGVPAIPALFGNKCIKELNENYFMIFDWINAEKISESEITKNHCEKLGEALAKIHLTEYENLSRKKKSKLAKICVDWNRYSKFDSKSARMIMTNREKLYKWSNLINDVADKIKEDVINHNDMDIKNVLWDKDDNPMLIDWEAAGYSNSLSALLQVASDWSFSYSENFMLDFFSAVIKGYIKGGGNVSGDTNTVLDYSFKGMLEWLEYSANRSLGIGINDESERKPGEEQALFTMKALLNYERNLEEINRCLLNCK